MGRTGENILKSFLSDAVFGIARRKSDIPGRLSVGQAFSEVVTSLWLNLFLFFVLVDVLGERWVGVGLYEILDTPIVYRAVWIISGFFVLSYLVWCLLKSSLIAIIAGEYVFSGNQRRVSLSLIYPNFSLFSGVLAGLIWLIF